MRLNTYDVVVFDLDDTLYMERDYIDSGFRAVGRFLGQEYQWPPWRVGRFIETCRQRFQAGQRGNIFDTALARINDGYPSPPIDTLVQVYRQHVPEVSLQPDAQCLLDELHQHSNTWIITDGPLDSQRAKVKALGLARRVRRVIYTDRWGQEFWKPHPRAFQQLQFEADVRAQDCIYIADNPAKDFRAPRELGWATLRVRRAGGLHVDCEPAPSDAADHELPSLWPLCQAATSESSGRAI